VLVETGFWPGNVPFEQEELMTVVKVLNDRARKANRVR
jgi:hypothetical protein